MKNKLTAALLFSSCTLLVAQKSAVVTVIINGSDEPKAFLQKDQESYAANLVDGRYKFQLSLDGESFFDFGTGHSGAEIYVEPGDSITVTAEYDNFDKTLKFGGTKILENTYLHQRNRKRKFYAPLLASIRSYPEQIFLDSLDSIIDQMRADFDRFQETNPGISVNFKKHENTNFDFITANQKSVFVNNYSSNHTDGSQASPGFNGYLKALKFNDASLLPSPRFKDFLRNIRYNETFALIGRRPELASPATDHINAMFLIIDSLFTDPAIKNYSLYTTLKFELRQLGLAIPPEIVQEYYVKCTNEQYKTEIRENYLTWTTLRKGAEAPSFKVVDQQGAEISLDNFKGKVVYIDVWATWCGPCLKEMPAMNSLAALYKDNSGIVFVKISIDANQQLWRAKTAKESDSPILNLWAENGANSKFARTYAIKDIPRYILIDRQGKIVDAQTLAPSQMKDKLNALVNTAN